MLFTKKEIKGGTEKKNKLIRTKYIELEASMEQLVDKSFRQLDI